MSLVAWCAVRLWVRAECGVTRLVSGIMQGADVLAAGQPRPCAPCQSNLSGEEEGIEVGEERADQLCWLEGSLVCE